MTDFTGGVAAFTAALREDHGFGVGHAATRDALRAAEIVGVGDGARLRRALRAVYCATPDEVARFDPAFDAFFLGAQGIAQPNLASRHTRPGRPQTPGEDKPSGSPRSRDERRGEAETDEGTAPVVERRPGDDETSAAETWQALRARYSAVAARSAPPAIARAGLDAMLADADRLIARVRIARSRPAILRSPAMQPATGSTCAERCAPASRRRASPSTCAVPHAPCAAHGSSC